MVISTDGSETKTGFRLETVNTNESSGTTWGGSYSYAEMLVGEVPLVDPSADQSPDQYSGQSPDGTPPVPPPNPVDVPDHPDSAAEPVTTIFYTEQWEGSQSQHDYDSYSDVTAFGFSGVTTTTRLGFGGGGYLLNLESSSVLDWNQTTGDIESPNWSVIAYHENSQVDLTHSGGYLSLTSLTITDGGSNPLMDGVTGSYLEDGSDHTNILITTLGTASYADASVITHDGPTVEPTVTSAISSVDNSDQTIHIISGDEYSDIVTFSGNDSLTLDHSQTDTFSFALTSLGDGTLSLQTEMDYPQDGNSLATFTESYTQTMLLDSGSTTNSSFTAQTDGEDTTVTLGPIAETGTSASSFDYAATGTSTFQSSETGTYTAPVPSADPNSGEPIDPNQAVSSPFTGLPTLTVIDSNETWTDSLSFSDQSEYEQTINFNPDDSWSLNRTETGSGTSSFDQTLISSLTINDEVGSIDDGLGAVFTYGETNNLHSWNDGDSSYVQTLSLISSAPTDPDETTPPDSETTPPDNADITILLTHDETGESSSGLDLETTGSQSYQAVGMTETIVESTPPTDGSPPTTLTEPVSFELATSDNWQQTLSILGTVAYTTGLTLSSQDGLALDVSQTGESHSALHSEFSSTYNLLTETTHADLTSTTALYEDQSTLAYVADDSYLYSLESHLAISNDDEVTISGTLVESSDGASNGTAATNGSYQTSTNQAPSTPGDLPLVLQTSEDIWTDQLTFNDLYEFDRTTILNADGSFTIDHQQSGSGDSAFDHVGSGSSDDADETTPSETYQHHLWENSNYSYTLSATIASVPADSESSSTDPNDSQAFTGNTGDSGNTLVSPGTQITDFSYVSTSHKQGSADLSGTSEFAKSLIGTLPVKDAETLANGPTITIDAWDETKSQQQGMEFLDENADDAVESGIASIEYVVFIRDPDYDSGFFAPSQAMRAEIEKQRIERREQEKRTNPSYIFMDTGTSKGDLSRKYDTDDSFPRKAIVIGPIATVSYFIAGWWIDGAYYKVKSCPDLETMAETLVPGESGKIGRVEFWGHGNSGYFMLGRHTIDIDALDPNIKPDHYIQLMKLRDLLDPKFSEVHIQACKVFKGEEGAAFGQALADFLGVPVHSYAKKIFWPFTFGRKSFYPKGHPNHGQ